MDVNSPQIVVVQALVTTLRKQVLEALDDPLAFKVRIVDESVADAVTGRQEPQSLVRLQALSDAHKRMEWELCLHYSILILYSTLTNLNQHLKALLEARRVHRVVLEAKLEVEGCVVAWAPNLKLRFDWRLS